MASPAKDRKPAPLPAPNSDFYELIETLPAEELAVVKQVRTFMETKVAPIITKYWVEDAFPFEKKQARDTLPLETLTSDLQNRSPDNRRRSCGFARQWAA